MATENKGVMVYLPPELETLLEKYCIDRNITRKTRDGHVFASLGTGIVQYLKSQLLGAESNSSISSSTSLTKDDVLELIRENNTSNSTSTVSQGIGADEVTAIIDLKMDSLVTSPTPNASEIEQLITAQIEPLADLLTELETYTQTQFKAVREELKKPLAIAR
jgi:hypothetical protein